MIILQLENQNNFKLNKFKLAIFLFLFTCIWNNTEKKWLQKHTKLNITIKNYIKIEKIIKDFVFT